MTWHFLSGPDAMLDATANRSWTAMSFRYSVSRRLAFKTPSFHYALEATVNAKKSSFYKKVDDLFS